MGGSLCFIFWHSGTLAPLHNGSCLHCLWRGTNTINGHLLTWTITSTHTLIRDTICGTDFNHGMIRTGATEIYCIGLLKAIYCVNTMWTTAQWRKNAAAYNTHCRHCWQQRMENTLSCRLCCQLYWTLLHCQLPAIVFLFCFHMSIMCRVQSCATTAHCLLCWVI